MPHMASTPVRRRVGSVVSLIALTTAITVGTPLIASADDDSAEQAAPSSSLIATSATDVPTAIDQGASTPDETVGITPTTAAVSPSPTATESVPADAEAQGGVGVELIAKLGNYQETLGQYRVIGTNSETKEDSAFYAIGGGQGTESTLQILYGLDLEDGAVLTVRSERADGKKLYYDGSQTGTFDASKALPLTVAKGERVRITLNWAEAEAALEVQPPSPETLTESTKGEVQVPESGSVGHAVTVQAGAELAGSTVNGWLFSTPTYLGASTVDSSGNVVFTIPDSVPAGAHRLAITDAQNNLIGWGAIQIDTAAATDGGLSTGGSAADQAGSTSTLAATGNDAPIGAVATGVLLLLAGCVLVVVRSRSRRA